MFTAPERKLLSYTRKQQVKCLLNLSAAVGVSKFQTRQVLYHPAANGMRYGQNNKSYDDMSEIFCFNGKKGQIVCASTKYKKSI